MKFEIKHTTNHYIRIRLGKKTINDNEAFNLKYTLLEEKCLHITNVIVHQRPAALMIEHEGKNDDIANYLENLDLEALNVDIPSYHNAITSKKDFYKRMTPSLKRELRKEVLVEAAIDILLPEPVGIAYHVLQLASLQ